MNNLKSSSSKFETPKYEPSVAKVQFQPRLQNAQVYEMPLQIKNPVGMKIDHQSLIDWINSFDDSFCVLVSVLPEDLKNGVIISHLVGYIVCSFTDRQMIFDLLNYPPPNSNYLERHLIKENFELAYNVLKCGQKY
jgi:hypothetical protein